MFAEVFRAAILAGIPVGLVSFGLVWWALRSDYFEKTNSLKSFEKEVSLLSKAQSKNKKNKDIDSRKLNPVHNKWLKFGGGFYGVVALITFGIIEFRELVGFLSEFRVNIGRLADFNFDLIINVFIDQLMNFFSALAWPWYWMNEIHSGEIWVWFLAAYGGYWLGARAALSYSNNGGDQS